MFLLFRSELLRYRMWIIGMAILHLGAWTALRTIDPNTVHRPMLVGQNIVVIACLGLGLLFGLLQMGLYKRMAHWTYLIHRPLAPSKIYMSLSLAVLAMAFVVCCLPWMIFVLSQDLFTQTPVDLRHYLHGFYMLALAYGTYQTGSFIQLNANKGSLFVAVLVLFILGHGPMTLNHAPGETPTFFLVTLLVLGWLYTLSLTAFKPDLMTAPKSGWVKLMTALPMQLGLTSVVWIMVYILYSISLYVYPTHPHENPKEGSERHFRLMGLRDGIIHLLDQSEIPDVENLKSQVRLGDDNYSSGIYSNYANRGQMLFQDKQLSMINDKQSESYWVFSHADMLYKGTHVRTGESLGWLGKYAFKDDSNDFQPNERFATIPNIQTWSGNHYLYTQQTIYRVDFVNKLIQIKHLMEGDEFYYGILFMNQNYASISSNLNLYMFDPDEFRDDSSIEPEYVVPHIRPIRNISHIPTIRLVDGYLLKYGNDYFYGGGRPGVALVRIKLDGTYEVLLEKEFSEFSDPALVRYESLVISPLLYSLQNAIWNILEPAERRHRRIQLLELELGAPMKWSLVIVSLLCGLITFLMARKRTNHVILWTCLNTLVGIPGLISFLFFIKSS